MEPKVKKKKYADQPRDLQNVVSILQKTGIEKYESNVPHMLMEFAHAFSGEVLDDSRNFAEYAGRPNKIEISDVQLAIQSYNEKYFNRPLPVPYMKELANLKNQATIPTISPDSSLDVDFPSADQYAMQNEYHIDSEELRAELFEKKQKSIPKI